MMEFFPLSTFLRPRIRYSVILRSQDAFPDTFTFWENLSKNAKFAYSFVEIATFMVKYYDLCCLDSY